MKQIFFFCCASALWALPQAPLIQNGDVQFSNRTDTLMEIQASDRAIIDWKEFSIELGEHVRIHQPSASSSLLNRVIEAYPSRLLGNLEANGQVLLINPNGILVGKEAHIDTGSFIASTLDLQNRTFLENSALVFEGDSSEGIVNEGIIHTSEGELYLIGHTVINKGTAEADGAAALIAGTKVILKPAGFEHIYVRGDSFSEAFVHPDEPEWDIVSQAINEGSVRATDVYICGEQVGLCDGSKIDVTGDLGGGNVWIGGDYQGQNKVIENARYTWVEPGAEIDASAKQEGNAGQIIVWGEKGTAFYGNAFARGGPLGGDGGFVEISGKEMLEFRGNVDLHAALGKTGDLLLDPCVVTIDVAATTATVVPPPPYPPCPGCGIAFTFPALAAATINNVNLAFLLGTCCNVTIDATASGVAAVGTITLNAGAPVIWASANSLTLNADTITIRDSIQNTAPVAGGNVTLIANTAINIGPSTVNASVGSLSGATIVNAPSADFTITASPVSDTNSQLGFYLPIAIFPTPITGPITVTCRNLNLFGTLATGFDNSTAVIGHGKFDFSCNGACPSALITTAAATITVATSGNITLLSGAPENATARIGHGASEIANVAPGTPTSLRGDISVSCSGDVLLESQPGFQIVRNAGIGHGVCRHSGFRFIVDANIAVNAGGDITLRSSVGPGIVEDIYIGHLCDDGGDVTGDVDVHSGGSIFMRGGPLLFQRMWIGQIVIDTINPGVFGPVTTNVRVSACQDLVINANAAQYCYIGTNGNWTTVNQTVSVVVGRDLIMTDTTGTIFGGTGGGRIGMLSPTVPALSASTTLVACAGNILMSGVNLQAINAFGNVVVTSGGNITVQPQAGNSHFIGTTILDRGFVTQIWANGNITGQNGAVGQAIFGQGPVPIGMAPFNHSLDMRAGGNIQIPSSFPTAAFAPTAGFIFLEADTQLPAGALWTNTGGAVNTIGGFAPPAPVTTSLCLGTGITANSAPIFSNCDGGLLFDPNPLVAVPRLFTTTGNITLHSGPNSGGFSVNLSLGLTPGVDDVFIGTTNGNIEIFGTDAGFPCRCSFFDVTINQNICTTGTVLICADNNITMAPGSSIGGLAACGALIPSRVTLVVDNQAPTRSLIGSGGSFGGFFMDATAEINSTGPIRIFTALQSINRIDGTINTAVFSPGTLYECTNGEIWCSYFCDGLFCPMSGVPFTIAYKDCRPNCSQCSCNASCPVMEFLIDLHPFNEFPGWVCRYFINYKPEYFESRSSEPYYFRRRNLNLFNHPKSYTVWLNDEISPDWSHRIPRRL